MKVITMCHWRRPQYTRKALEHLGRCHGIGDYTVFLNIDSKPDLGVLLECAKFKPLAKRVLITEHKSHLGCNGNTFSALRMGFNESDYVIHIEDDILVSRDSLRFMEWARQFESDSGLFSVTLWKHLNGWNGPPSAKPKDNDCIAANWINFFAGWGWATWKSRWSEIEKGWTKGGDMDASWDIVLSEKVRSGRDCLAPFCSRAVNIGAEGGTHRGASPLPYWAESAGFDEPKEYLRL